MWGPKLLKHVGITVQCVFHSSAAAHLRERRGWPEIKTVCPIFVDNDVASKSQDFSKIYKKGVGSSNSNILWRRVGCSTFRNKQHTRRIPWGTNPKPECFSHTFILEVSGSHHTRFVTSSLCIIIIRGCTYSTSYVAAIHQLNKYHIRTITFFGLCRVTGTSCTRWIESFYKVLIKTKTSSSSNTICFFPLEKLGGQKS